MTKDHDDQRLDVFCLEHGEPVDVFNKCHNQGWLISRHDDRTDSSTVYLTEAGAKVLVAA